MGLIDIFKPLSIAVNKSKHHLKIPEKKHLGMLGIEPRAAGWEARMQTLCDTVPQSLSFLSSQNFYLDVDAAGTALDTEEIGHAGTTNSWTHRLEKIMKNKD